jgi:hypothetical protein
MSPRLRLGLKCHAGDIRLPGLSHYPNQAPKGTLDSPTSHCLDGLLCPTHEVRRKKLCWSQAGAMSLRRFRRGCVDPGAETHRWDALGGKSEEVIKPALCLHVCIEAPLGWCRIFRR